MPRIIDIPAAAPRTTVSAKRGGNKSKGKKAPGPRTDPTGKLKAPPPIGPVGTFKEKTVKGINYSIKVTEKGQRVLIEGNPVSTVLRYLGYRTGGKRGEGKTFIDVKNAFQKELKLVLPHWTCFAQFNSGRLSKTKNYTRGGHGGENVPHHGETPKELPGAGKILKVLFPGETFPLPGSSGKAKAKK